MSVITSTRVWKRSTKGGAALLLLLAMADWSDDWGYCYPSLVQMANKCRQTDRNILNLIRELELAGELRRVARGKGGRGKFSGSVYQVTAGMRAEEITTSEQVSPLAQTTLGKLQSGEMSQPVPRKKSTKTGEKISPENFSPEKQSPDFSPVFPSALNELINVNDSPPASAAAPKINSNPGELAEGLYRLVRPTHLAIPNSDQRAVALKVLKARLYEKEVKEKEEKMDELHSTKKEIAWGSQIRSYTMHPYKMVKDHRTAKVVHDVDRIMDGDLTEFMEAYLLTGS